MRPSAKLGVVAGGYLAALLLAIAAVAVHAASTSGPDRQASGGMHAFGDALIFLGVFGIASLAPSGTALYFLRPYPRFWSALSALGLTVAFTGVAAAILFAVGRHAPPSPLATLAGLSLLRILVAPLLALSSALCGALTPQPTPRLVLLAAAALETAVGAFGASIWLVPLLLHRT